MAPLKNHRVIPAGWSDHHRPVAEETMTALCEIFVLGQRTGLDEAEEKIVYPMVRCRVQELNRASDVVTAGRETQTREYLVTTPYEVDVTAGTSGYRIRILDSRDPHLVGRIFTVLQVMYGSEIWERDLICIDDMGAGYGS